jgi:hypothetical protein
MWKDSLTVNASKTKSEYSNFIDIFFLIIIFNDKVTHTNDQFFVSSYFFQFPVSHLKVNFAG